MHANTIQTNPHVPSRNPPTGWTESIPIADAPLRIHARHDDTAVGPQGQEAVEDVVALYGADGEAVPPDPAFVNSLEQWQAVDAQDCQGAWYQVPCLCYWSFILCVWSHSLCRRLLCADPMITFASTSWAGQLVRARKHYPDQPPCPIP